MKKILFVFVLVAFSNALFGQRTLVVDFIRGLEKIYWEDGHETRGVSNDTTLSSQDSFDLVTEWAMKQFVLKYSTGGGGGAQVLSYDGGSGSLSISGGNSVIIKVSEQVTEEIFSNLTSGNSVTVSTVFPTDLSGVKVYRNGVLQNVGVGLDCSILGQIITFNLRDFEHGERVSVIQTK